jgi:hypothetical protein
MTKITRARFLELSGVLAGAVGFGRSLEAELCLSRDLRLALTDSKSLLDPAGKSAGAHS